MCAAAQARKCSRYHPWGCRRLLPSEEEEEPAAAAVVVARQRQRRRPRPTPRRRRVQVEGMLASSVCWCSVCVCVVGMLGADFDWGGACITSSSCCLGFCF